MSLGVFGCCAGVVVVQFVGHVGVVTVHVAFVVLVIRVGGVAGPKLCPCMSVEGWARLRIGSSAWSGSPCGVEGPVSDDQVWRRYWAWTFFVGVIALEVGGECVIDVRGMEVHGCNVKRAVTSCWSRWPSHGL